MPAPRQTRLTRQSVGGKTLTERKYHDPRAEKPPQQQDFTYRFLKALCDPPIAGVLYDQGWNPSYKAGIDRVNKVCEERKICDHGMRHIARTAQNAFILGDTVGIHFSEAQPAVKTRWEQMFSDTNMLLPILVHDLGYASENTTWEGKHGTNHAEESAVMLDTHLVHARPDAVRLVTAQDEIFKRTITEESSSLLADAVFMLKHPLAVTPDALFPLVIQASDKLDYFHEDRVSEISDVPSTFEENPYYFLADAVRSYALKEIDGAFVYEVELKEGYDITTQAGVLSLDIELWTELVGQHYPKVLQLAGAVAALTGRKFVIEHRMIPPDSTT